MKKLFFHTIVIPHSCICCYHWLTCKAKTISILQSWHILLILTIYSNNISYTAKTTIVRVTDGLHGAEPEGRVSGLIHQQHLAQPTAASSLLFPRLSCRVPHCLVSLPCTSGSFTVCFAGSSSSSWALNAGVPKGSVLDSFLSLYSLPRWSHPVYWIWNTYTLGLPWWSSG